MNLIKASTKPMVQGRSTGNDLKKIVFSHQGQFYISIDRNFHVILWSVKQQVIIKEFDSIQCHYGSFSPRDDRLFIIGRQKLYIFQIINTLQTSTQSKIISQNQSSKTKTSSEFILSQIKQQQNPKEASIDKTNSLKNQMKYIIKQIKRFENGFFMGTVECSPNNLYFAYTNSSQLYIRDMVNYERIFHIPYLNNTSIKKQLLPQITQVSSQEIHKFSQSCSPFFVKFNYKTGDLYTTSLNEGDICKWGIAQMETQINSQTSQKKYQYILTEKQKMNIRKYPIYVKVKNTLSTIVSDIDFSDTNLLISSDRNRRKLFILNETSLQIQGTRIMPKAFFLDFNTEIQSTYSYQNNVIISIAVPGDFLFIHNGTSFAFIKSQQLQMNIYSLEYSKAKNILSLGGQVASRQDQIIFYNVENNLDKQCPEDYFWQNSSQRCQKLQCLFSQSEKGINPLNKNQCKCSNPYENWNSLYQACVLDCELIQNSFNTGFFPSIFKKIQQTKINYCPCKQGFKWNFNNKKCQKFSCISIQGSTGRLNYPFSINECKCNQNFSFDSKAEICKLNCEKIQNAIGLSFFQQGSFLKEVQNKAKQQVQSCHCKDGFYWNQRVYSCLKQKQQGIQTKPPTKYGPSIPEPSPSNSNLQKNYQFPILAVIIPLIIIIIMVGIFGIFCYRYRKSKKIQTSKNQQTNKSNKNEIQSQFDSYKSSKKSKDLNTAISLQANISLKQNFQNGQNNLQIIKQDQLNQNEISKKDNQHSKVDNNITKRRKSRKLFRIDKQKTAKNIKDIQEYQDNLNIISSDRPITNIHAFISYQKDNQKQNIKNTNTINKNILNCNQKNIKGKKNNTKNLNQNHSSLGVFSNLKPLKEQSSTSNDKSSTLFSKDNYPCQLCFQNDANCFTKCYHYFHINCLNEQFQKMKQKHQKKQCPSCWQILQNQQNDIFLFEQNHIKNKNNQKQNAVKIKNYIKEKSSKSKDKSDEQESEDIDENDVNFFFNQDSQQANQ